MIKSFGVFLLTLATPLICFAGLPENYQTLSAVQKQEILWANILTSAYANLPSEDSILPDISLLKPHYLLSSFTNTSDELSPGRKKLIHAYGSTAQIEFKITNPKYAGIFKSGGIGLARLSIARMSNAKTDFTPGMAIKILIDGQDSVNFHVMNSVDGQGSNHFFFARPFSNILPDAKSFAGRIISHAFGGAVELLNRYLKGRGPHDAGHLPLLQACQLTRESPSCPYQIIFVPGRGLGHLVDQGLEVDFRRDLAKIPPETVLYDIVVKGGTGETEENIGALVTKSRFVASSYGDTKLFFSHTSLSR